MTCIVVCGMYLYVCGMYVVYIWYGIHICVYKCIYVYISVYMCIYVYICGTYVVYMWYICGYISVFFVWNAYTPASSWTTYLEMRHC